VSSALETLLNLIITIQILTATGALAPGPLFVANLVFGSKEGWKAGLKMSIGHTLVEFPLFIMIAFGILSAITVGGFTTTLGILGGVTMIAFGILELTDSIRARKKGSNLNNSFLGKFGKKGALLMGAALSAFNPFFILWWILIGSTFIYASTKILSYTLLPLIYVTHVWMDYVWLIFTAHLSYVGKNVLKEERYRYFVGALGLILILFGLNFLFKSLLGFSLLPL